MKKLQEAAGHAKTSARVRKILGIQEDPNLKVGINGFGRLGRLVARAIMETDGVDLIAINDPYVDAEYMAYMLQHDEVHGPCRHTVEAPDRHTLIINGRQVTLMNTREPSKVDWRSGGARYIIEASGRFTSAKAARDHLYGGAEHVIIAAACTDVPQLLAGVNQTHYKGEAIVSCGSAAAHCLALFIKVVEDAFGIALASASVLQVCSTQELQQVCAGPAGENGLDWRSSTGGSKDVIPTVAEAVGAVRSMLPDLADNLFGAAFRVPAMDGSASVIDLTVELKTGADLEQIRAAVSAAASCEPMRGRLGFRDDDVDGSDFEADGRSAIFDGRASMALSPTFVKLVVWYPGDWAYARRLVELLLHMQATDRGAGVPHMQLPPGSPAGGGAADEEGEDGNVGNNV
jgi:glyceraldehyde 3-phosphate dehydrogenase